MRDFSKWAAMWDAYNRMGEAVSGSPASICQGIGLTMAIVGIIGAFIRLASESDKLVTTSAAVFLAGLLGVALQLTSLFLPSHNDAHVSEPPALSTQIERTWGLDEIGDCKNTSHGLTDSPSLPKSSLDDGDWKCVAYTDSQRTELTVHIKGDKVGLYKADGKALAANGKEWNIG